MRTKKEVSGPSITEAVCDVLEFGTPRNKQVAETHFELLRQVQGDPLRSSFAVRGGKNLCLPFSAFCRQLAVGTPARGREWVGEYTLAGASDLLSCRTAPNTRTIAIAAVARVSTNTLNVIREREGGRGPYGELFYLPFSLIQRAPLKGALGWEQSPIVIDLPFESSGVRPRMAFT